MGISPVPLTSRFLSRLALLVTLSALSASRPGPPLPDTRHCPILSIRSNLTSAQKKAKKPMKEAQEEADIAALQRFWVKSAIGRFIRRDCS